MADIQTVSIAVASAGVFAAAMYYIFQLRHQNKVRQTDLIVRMYSAFTSDDFLAALMRVYSLEFKDYKDFLKKHGSPSLETPVNIAIYKVGNYFDEAGLLLHKGLIDADLASEFLMTSTLAWWNKLKPIVEGVRKDLEPSIWHWFEYFYNEMKKREQRLHQS